MQRNCGNKKEKKQKNDKRVKHRDSQILPATNICSSEKSCEMQRKCFSYCGVPYFESLEDGVIEQLTEI